MECSVRSAEFGVRLLSAENFRQRGNTAPEKPFAIHYSLFATHYLLFANRCRFGSAGTSPSHFISSRVPRPSSRSVSVPCPLSRAPF